MLLAIDLGNTNIVIGVHKNRDWINHWRIQTDALQDIKHYEIQFQSLLNSESIILSDINAVVLSSVVPLLINPFQEMINKLFPEAPLTIVNPGIYNQLPIKVLNPDELGTDLVANAVSAFQRFGDYTMIIDFGTALTFTTIGKDAEIAGVAIAPGLRTAVRALSGDTAQLPHIQLSPPPSVLGDNTEHAIQAGIVFGFAGLVDSIVERTEKELDNKLQVVATGGLCGIIAPLSKRINTVDKMLTLDGLRRINSLAKA